MCVCPALLRKHLATPPGGRASLSFKDVTTSAGQRQRQQRSIMTVLHAEIFFLFLCECFLFLPLVSEIVFTILPLVSLHDDQQAVRLQSAVSTDMKGEKMNYDKEEKIQ